MAEAKRSMVVTGGQVGLVVQDEGPTTGKNLVVLHNTKCGRLVLPTSDAWNSSEQRFSAGRRHGDDHGNCSRTFYTHTTKRQPMTEF